MKNTTNKKSRFLFLNLIIAIAFPAIINAQPMPDSNDVDTPIDGGISLLVAAGAIVGAKKIKYKKDK